MKRANNHTLAGLLFVFVLAGCSAGVDPEVQKIRDALLLSQEPSGSVTIEDARANIESQTDIVLTGRIGVKDLSQWWAEGSSSFYISEGTEGSHYNAGPDHDPSTCPFCRRKWVLEDSMATIQLVDSSGAPYAVDANRILAVKEGDLVVLRGKAKVDENGMLTLNCDGLAMK